MAQAVAQRTHRWYPAFLGGVHRDLLCDELAVWGQGVLRFWVSGTDVGRGGVHDGDDDGVDVLLPPLRGRLQVFASLSLFASGD